MKRSYTPFFLLLFLAIIASNTAIAVEVDSVRYCRNASPWPCNAKTQSEYNAWSQRDVPKRHQKRTYIARYSTPSPAATKHLIFFADGQANAPDWDLNGDSDTSVVTGRVNDFRDHFSRDDRSRNITEVQGNLPQRILNGELSGFSANNTFIATSWDARFHYASSSSTLSRVANAHFDWLEGKFVRNNLDVIILAGHSRGGALVTVLAKKFRDAYPEIPVMVYTLEGVANPSRSVPSISSTKIDNPIEVNVPILGLVPAGEAYSFDFEDHYGQTDLLRAVNVLTGRSFLPFDVNSVRPMAQTNPINGTQRQFFDWGWFQQEWVRRGHNEFNNSWAADYVFNDIQLHVDDLISERARVRPPVARCRATPSSVVGTSAIAQFADSGSTTPPGTSIVLHQWEFFKPNGELHYGVSGAGPHNYWVYDSGHSRAELTVINSEGVRGSSSCLFQLINFAPPTCERPEISTNPGSPVICIGE